MEMPNTPPAEQTSAPVSAIVSAARGRVLLHLDRCALIRDVDTLNTSDEVSASSNGGSSVPIRIVPSLGIAARIASSSGQNAQGGQEWAVPVQVTLTDRALLATAVGSAQTGDWDWPLDMVTELIGSASEPCTVIGDGQGRFALLVPRADVVKFRDTLAAALRSIRSRGQAPSQQPGHIGPPSPQLSPEDGIHTERHMAETRPLPPRRRLKVIPGLGDRVFRGSSWAGGVSVLVIMGLVGVFLLARGMDALRATGLRFLTTSAWQPDSHNFGIAAVLSGTVMIALVSLAVSVPLAVGTALYISEAAPRRIRGWLVSGVDLMAAVPSVVYGLWGFKFLQGHVIGLARWISTWFSWIPIFRVTGADPRNPLASPSVYTASTFVAGLVVALMVIPIACSIMREVFSQAPAGEREGAFALGATRWGMMRAVVLPFGRGGMIGAVMLGMGRALGETVAVYLIISPVFRINWHILQSGSNSVSALIVLRQGDASGFGLSALMAAGLSLFLLTLVVNFTASIVVSRSRSGSLSEA